MCGALELQGEFFVEGEQALFAGDAADVADAAAAGVDGFAVR